MTVTTSTSDHTCTPICDRPALGAVLRRADVIERRRRLRAEGRWMCGVTMAERNARWEAAIELGHIQQEILTGGRQLAHAARDLRLIASALEDAAAAAARREAVA